MTKIDDYLTTGFVEWLTGAMSGVGIEMPEDIFSLEGIFSITTQALGMTWDFIRERAVGVLGEKAVGTIEESFEIFQILRTDGMGGAWDTNWENLTAFLEYPKVIRKLIYTTNIIESFNASLRKYTKNKRVFPTIYFEDRIL